MEAHIYLPYEAYDDSFFDVGDGYYANANDYINAVSEEYNRNKDAVFESMVGLKNGSPGALIGSDGQMYKFGEKTSQSEEKVAYTECFGVLYNADGNMETVDNIITHFAKQEMFMEMISLDLDRAEEEFETELSLWVGEYNSINKYLLQKGEEWVLANEPKRTLRMRFLNNANEELFAELRDCRILDVVDNGTYIIHINKIVLIGKF